MDLKLGIAIIGTSLLLASAQQRHPDPEHACTTYTDLSHPCGCAFTKATFDPQCGSDGQTYLNTCYFECRMAVSPSTMNAVTIAYAGVCDHEFKCECHTEYKPVCGSNGVTYSNKCTLKCASDKDSSIQLDHEGTCVGDQKPGKTTEDNQEGQQCPKCREKKKNQRQLRTEDYYSESKSREKEFLRPSDENFEMPPNINIDDHIIKPSTKPPNVTKKKCLCAEMHSPVCGSNHKTYANFCVFHCASKKIQTLKLSHWGECTKTDEKNKADEDNTPSKKCKCATVHRPVCANTQKTYPNLCALHCDILKDDKLHFYYWGICAEKSTTKKRERFNF